jgi:hypothetical protein
MDPNKFGLANYPKDEKPGRVYEVVDITSEEVYYPAGIYPTLIEALQSLDDTNPEDYPSFESDDQDYFEVEIRARPFGFGDFWRAVATCVWVREYDDDENFNWVQSLKVQTNDK